MILDSPYRLVLLDGSEHTFMGLDVDVTPITATGINTQRAVVFVVPVAQVKLLERLNENQGS